jgi:hypothetical protein
MTEDNRAQSRADQDPKTTPNRPAARRGANEDPEARRAFERDRLHPALRLDQQYPAVKPQRHWSVANDDATAPARPVMPETLTDLAPEIDSRANRSGFPRILSILLGLIIVFGFVVLLVLVTQQSAL